MDLNDLFARHQVSVIRARYAACAPSRSAHRELATAYAAQAGSLQREMGARFCFSPRGQAV